MEKLPIAEIITLHSVENFRKYVYGEITLQQFRESKSGISVEKIFEDNKKIYKDSKALEVAKYFLSLCDESAGDLMSNLRLQKLIYYAQGFHLALFDAPLFHEPIEAWIHGPVVPDVYYVFEEFGSGAICDVTSFDSSSIKEEVRNLLDEVYSVYGQFSAWKLENMTREEVPWVNASKRSRADTSKRCNIISLDEMKIFFNTLVKKW
jgi:uncharacterized phage-associated protein